MLLRALSLAVVAGLAFLGWGYGNAVADPLVRRASFGLVGWPAGQQPLRVALIADPHLQGPDMPPRRIARIADQVRRARPDVILLAGDFVGSRTLGTRTYDDAEIATALRHFTAPLGTYAVLGNHDHWRDGPAMRRALEAVGIPVLDNRAVRIRALTLVGAGDAHTRHADIAALTRIAADTRGPKLLFAHSPDVIPQLPAAFALVLTGHTHCGQIVLPLIGAVASASNYGERYRCGVVHEGGRAIVVSAGLGASVLPLRYGAVPDWWLITVGPKPR